jgi:hypothetical protein
MARAVQYSTVRSVTRNKKEEKLLVRQHLVLRARDPNDGFSHRLT